MKKHKLLITLLLVALQSNALLAQVILNGDFENNTSGTACNYNLPNATFNTLMSNVLAFGTASEVDIMSTCAPYCNAAQSGTYYIALAIGSGPVGDAVSMTLSSPLVPGNSYTLSFWDHGSDDQTYAPTPIRIGVSTVNNAIGTLVYTGPIPTPGVWTQRIVTFVAPNNGLYITASVAAAQWSQVDNFAFVQNSLPPVASFSVNDTTICAGTCVNFTNLSQNATGYNWSFPGSNHLTDSSANPTNICYNTPGTYDVSLIVTNSSGSDTLTLFNYVTVYAAPAIQTSSSTAVCSGDSTVLTASGASTYSWLPCTNLNICTGSSVTASPLLTTAYSVTGTDVNGCSSSASITVTVNPVPVLVPPVAPAMCEGSSVTLTMSGAVNYHWLPTTGLSNPNGADSSSVTATLNATTTYTVTGYSANGCSSTASFAVTVNQNPPATLDPNGAIAICNTAGVMLNANAGDYNYVWYHDGVIVQSGAGSTYFATSPGVYQVQVSNIGNNCSSMSQTATIVLGGGPVASIVTSGGCGSILFNGGSVTLTGTSTNAVSYSWTPGGQTTASIQVTQPGTYCVTAYDVNGCPSDVPACTTVNTANVACGQNGQKVLLCHVPPGNPTNPQTLCISPNAVAAHLANHPGDCLGSCSLYYPRLSSAAYDDDITSSFYVSAYPNPFNGTFSLEIFNSSSEPMNLTIYDMLGRVVELYNDVNEKTLIGNHLKEGIYFVVAVQGDNMQRIRVVKE